MWHLPCPKANRTQLTSLESLAMGILIFSWAETAVSTFSHLYNSSTCKLPVCLPILHLPLAPRKSLAGFTPASITGALVAIGFWSLVALLQNGGQDVTWVLEGGVHAAEQHLGGGGWAGLALLGWWWEHEESLETGTGGDMLID